MLVKLLLFSHTFVLVLFCPEATLCGGWEIKIQELFLTDVQFHHTLTSLFLFVFTAYVYLGVLVHRLRMGKFLPPSTRKMAWCVSMTIQKSTTVLPCFWSWIKRCLSVCYRLLYLCVYFVCVQSLKVMQLQCKCSTLVIF